MTKELAWIDMVDDAEAKGALREAYDEVGRDGGFVHVMYKVFASRPDLLLLADRFYRELLHNDRRCLAAWEQEMVATQVAILCGCQYARDNHGANMVSLLGDESRGDEILRALETAQSPSGSDDRISEILAYTRKLTLTPGQMERSDVESLRDAGLDDATIFEVNQIAANFAYWSRMLNGLGIRAGDEQIGRYGKPV